MKWLRRRRLVATILILVTAVAASAWLLWQTWAPHRWSAGEQALLQSLALTALPPLPAVPSNRVADDAGAAALGRELFSDTRLSGDGAVACATCHVPALAFTDGKPLATGMGQLDRHSMSLVGAAWSMWFTWDGKADSQWSQALLPLENPAEQGIARTGVAHFIATAYAHEYTALFGPLPPLEDAMRFPPNASPAGDAAARQAWAQMTPDDQAAVNRVFANAGKALEAYQRTIPVTASRFDRYVEAVTAGDFAAQQALLSPDEAAGLRLFLGPGRCINCHNGPLFTNGEFHNTAVPTPPELLIDPGRAAGLKRLVAGEFTCLGPYSDARPEECTAMRFLRNDPVYYAGAFKTPTLRNVALTAPYMHNGVFATLAGVVEHYDGGGMALLGHNELNPLGLSADEKRQVEAFLGTLTGGG